MNPKFKLTLFGIRNCDTVKRARQALDAAGIDYRFHDFKTEGLDAGLAQSWIDALGADTVLNKRGTTWRKLSEADQARAECDAASLLAEQPSLVKRPVWDRNGEIRIGFARSDTETNLKWAAT